MKRFGSLFLTLGLLLAPTLGLAADKHGGTFRIGIEAATNLDPGFATSPPDIMIVSQIYERLVDIDTAFNPTPGLAVSWESKDGKAWTFKLRPGAKFSDGTPVTAKDVVWTFNRLRDPQIGTPVVGFFSNIVDIKAVAPETVLFQLKETNPEFPLDTGEYHALIIPDGTAKPADKHIGSGAYQVSQFHPEDRVILTKNPYFNIKDADGSALPYFDEVQFIFSPDTPGQVEALRGGDLNFVGMLPVELAEVVKNDPKTKLLVGDENQPMILQIRTDAGRPANDVRLRQAIQLATNQAEIIAAIFPGLASVGNTTPVGPPYRDYYLDRAPEFNLDKARALMKEAGLEKGLEIRLMTPTWGQNSQIATVWAKQMEAIGIKVNINMIPSDQYFSDGPDNWLECDFGLVPWGSRATPVTYYKMAFVTGADWNGAHWSDPEFDEVVRKIDTEMDKAKRIELYQASQKIFIERVPSVTLYVQKSPAASSKNVEGLTLGYAWITTRFWNTYFAK